MRDQIRGRAQKPWRALAIAPALFAIAEGARAVAPGVVAAETEDVATGLAVGALGSARGVTRGGKDVADREAGEIKHLRAFRAAHAVRVSLAELRAELASAAVDDASSARNTGEVTRSGDAAPSYGDGSRDVVAICRAADGSAARLSASARVAPRIALARRSDLRRALAAHLRACSIAGLVRVGIAVGSGIRSRFTRGISGWPLITETVKRRIGRRVDDLRQLAGGAAAARTGDEREREAGPYSGRPDRTACRETSRLHRA